MTQLDLIDTAAGDGRATGDEAPKLGRKRDLTRDPEILQRLAPLVGLGGLLDGTPREWKQRILRRDAGFTVEGAAEPTLPEHRRDLIKVRRRGAGTSLPANT